MNEESFEKLFEESVKDIKLDKTITGKIIAITREGEIFVDIGYKADGIIPKSEFSFDVSANPKDEFKVGDEITADVLKMNDGMGNVLLSYKRAKHRKEKQDRQEAYEIKIKKKDEFWNKIEVGQKYMGIVVATSSYGAFVDIEETAQGLLHISEISWDKNAKANEILEKGQEIPVTILELDKENKRFKLSYDNKGENPWYLLAEKYNVNDIVKVKVIKFMPFGVFVELEPGIEGLVHISQIAEKRVTKPEEELEIGQHVNAKIIEMDKENRKIGLSIRELEGTSNEYKEEI